MKNRLLLLAVLLAHAIAAHAQSDTIAVEKKGGRFGYKKGGEYLSLKMLEKALKDDAEATKIYRGSKTERATGTLFSLVGGFLVGYEAGRAFGSSTSIKPIPIIAGASLICIAVSFSVSAQRNIKRSVRTYNRNKNLAIQPHR